MNTDDMISMHKATESVIKSVKLAQDLLTISESTKVELALSCLTTLATIQRDIIAEVLS